MQEYYQIQSKSSSDEEQLTNQINGDKSISLSNYQIKKSYEKKKKAIKKIQQMQTQTCQKKRNLCPQNSQKQKQLECYSDNQEDQNYTLMQYSSGSTVSPCHSSTSWGNNNNHNNNNNNNNNNNINNNSNKNNSNSCCIQQKVKQKLVNISVFQYQVRSANKFYLSSSKVFSIDWFRNDPYVAFDMELYSEFIPVERVVFHKKEGVVELCQRFDEHPPDNVEYVIGCLDSISSQRAHFFADLLRQSHKKKNQLISAHNTAHQSISQNSMIDLTEIKRRALEIVEQQDAQKIFTYNIFIIDSADRNIKKVAQGYSQGFLKMMGATQNTFSNFVMKHKGFDAFSGKSRLDTIMMILCRELGLDCQNQLDKTAEVKTFDDYILKMTPSLALFPLNSIQTSFVTINHFDVELDHLIQLENIRKKSQLSIFQSDFRHQCHVSNFIEKFYPNEEILEKVGNNLYKSNNQAK